MNGSTVRDKLRIGQSARVAYVYTTNDREQHRLASLQIKPGTVIKLHQQHPSYVVECEGASIALDGEVAGNINVRLEGHAAPDDAPPRPSDARRAARNRRLLGARRRRGSR